MDYFFPTFFIDAVFKSVKHIRVYGFANCNKFLLKSAVPMNLLFELVYIFISAIVRDNSCIIGSIVH